MKIKLILSLVLAIACIPANAENSLIGKLAPQFTAPAVFPDGTVRTFNLTEYQGQNIVLYFYPMDNTPGCSQQAKIFRNHIQELNDAGILVLGISCDSIQSHINFKDKHGLPFPLISDSRLKRTISKAYGAAGFLYSQRKTFLIDQKGIVFHVFSDINLQTQIGDILHYFEQHAKNQ